MVEPSRNVNVAFKYLIIVWAVSAFFDRGVFSVFLIAYLYAHHWIHIETCKLTSLNHTNTDLEVLGFEARSQWITGGFRPATKEG